MILYLHTEPRELDEALEGVESCMEMHFGWELLSLQDMGISSDHHGRHAGRSIAERPEMWETHQSLSLLVKRIVQNAHWAIERVFPCRKIVGFGSNPVSVMEGETILGLGELDHGYHARIALKPCYCSNDWGLKLRYKENVSITTT